MITLEEFKKKFNFNPENTLKIGIERECFALRNGIIQPIAHEVLSGIWDWQKTANSPFQDKRLSYELSASQIEYCTDPRFMHEITDELESLERWLTSMEAMYNFKRSYEEVAPENLPLDIYPDPTGRYAQISQNMPTQVLSAACRVIGTHFHIGMPDHETALKTYNHVIEDCDRLCRIGDHSKGERLRLYRVVSPHSTPHPFSSWRTFHSVACDKDFVSNPRNCWTLIRISPHGTIEFRMFGATDHIPTIVSWAHECHRLCAEVVL